MQTQNNTFCVETFDDIAGLVARRVLNPRTGEYELSKVPRGWVWETCLHCGAPFPVIRDVDASGVNHALTCSTTCDEGVFGD